MQEDFRKTSVKHESHGVNRSALVLSIREITWYTGPGRALGYKPPAGLQASRCSSLSASVGYLVPCRITAKKGIEGVQVLRLLVFRCCQCGLARFFRVISSL